MKITSQITHHLTFQVYTCWSEEGGMGEDTFGNQCDSLEVALTNLGLARAHYPSSDWFIKTTVNTDIEKK